MREPRRLLESASELNVLERRLLRSASKIAPPAGAKRVIWLGIAGKVSVAAAGAGTATYSGLLLTVVKSAGVGVLLGAASIAGVQGLGALQAPAAKPNQANVRVAATAPAPPFTPAKVPSERVEPALASAPEHATTSKRTERAALASNAGSSFARTNAALPAAPASNSPSNENAEAASASLQREALALASARARLRAGDAAASLTQLNALERDFPRGLLVQERDALTIEALRATGQLPLARTRAAAFLARFPGSPHAESARRVLAE